MHAVSHHYTEMSSNVANHTGAVLTAHLSAQLGIINFVAGACAKQLHLNTLQSKKI